MSLKYLNLTGLSRVITNLKNWVTSRIPTKTSEITNDSGFITSSSLPTVNNATLTIQKNGTNVQTFTANASSNKTANITVPTKTSELTNDSGFLTSHQSLSNYVTLNSNQTLTSTKTFTTNINTTSTATSQRETWRLIFNKDSADTDSTTAVQLGVVQVANSHDFYAILRLANPRANNKPTTENTKNCWSGIGVFYNYDENRGRPYAQNCWDWPASSNSSYELASTSWVRTYCETTKGFLTNSALSTNFVTTDTAQTVAGEKTFTDNTWISSNTNKYFRIKNTSWDLGQATPSSDKEFGGICFRDKDDQNLSYIIAYSWSSGYEGLRIIYRTKFSNGEKSTSGSNVDSNFTIGIMPDGKRYCGTNGFWHTSLIPTVNNSITLGDTTYRWKAVYANAYYLGSTAFGDIVTHNASEFLTSHQSLSNYSTLANTVKSLSISGKTITVTPGSGNAYTLTTQDTVYTHPTTAGNKHIPSGGAANQYLKYSASGTAVWANLPAIPTKTSELTNDSGFLTSHQSLSNYVTLNTQQNISANKFFYGGAWRVGSNYPSFICKNNAHTVGEAAPSSMWGYGEILIQDKNAYSVGLLSCRYDQYATQYFRIESRNKFTNGAPDVNGTAASSVLDVGTLSNGTPYVYWNSYISNGLVPRLAFTWDIGDANHFWNRVYAAHYKIKGPNTQIGVTTSNSTVDFIDFIDANNTQVGYIGRWQHNNGHSCINLTCYDKYDGAGNRSTSGTVASGTLEIGVSNTGVPYLNYNTYFMQNISPFTNDDKDLGDTSHHWRNLFIGEMHCYHQNALMAKSGGYTFLLRNDGSYIWFLISEANGNEGTWSGLRPLYINCANGECTSSSKWIFNKSFGDGDPSVLIQSGAEYANGTWNYPLSALAPNMKAGANLFMPIGRSHSTGNCAGWHFHYAGNNSNDNCLTTEFYAAGSPLAVYRDGRVVLSASPAASDNSNRVATTAFVKAQGYTTSAASKKLVLLAERSEAGTWTITCDTLKPIYFKFTASKNDSNAEFVVGIDGSSTCRLVNVNYGYSTNQFSYQVTSTSSGGQATWGIGVPTSSTITVSVWLRNTQFQRYFNIKAYQ